MKYYVVGISSRRTEGFSPRVFGDALVYAPDKHKALTMVRNTGWVPNPGDIYILGGEGYKRYMEEYLNPSEIEFAKDKALEEGVAILWTSRE